MLAGYDTVICPTVPITAPPVSLLDDRDTFARLNLAMLRNKVSFLGLCAVTIPAGLDGAGLNGAGMRVGLQLIGAPRNPPSDRTCGVCRILPVDHDRRPVGRAGRAGLTAARYCLGASRCKPNTEDPPGGTGSCAVNR